jgi:putative ABC transport system permease protein
VLLTEDEYFFDRGVSVGDRVELEGKKFEIVGVLGRIGNPEDDSSLIIPLEAAREIFNEPDSYAYVMAQVSQGQDPEVVAERVKKALRKYRGVEEGEEDFSIQTFAELMESFQSVFAIVQAVLIGIAAISLLVGGIGIMNTMFTSVLQRTNQIGVMKAIGARNSDIFKLFLIESGFLGLFGGAIGVVIGIFLSKIVEFAAAGAGLPILKAYFPWYLILGALAFSFFVGCVSGLTPAVRASKLKPVDALRYE